MTKKVSARFLETIRSGLKATKITINPLSVRKNAVQGAGSEVFVADSNIGKLIIHKGKITVYEKRQHTWQKAAVISKLLKKYSQIPSARVILTVRKGKNYFVVQSMLPGRSPGKRIEKGNIIDIWKIWSKKLEQDIERNILRIHQIPLKGGGWIVERKGKIAGKYKTWEEFLKREVRIWIKDLVKKEKNKTLISKLKAHYATNKEKFKIKKSVLVHGDLINPSNILVSKNKVTGVVDWEIALAGDPAWEFCFNNRYGLKTYFNEIRPRLNQKQQEAFIERANLYEPFFLVRTASLLSKTDPAYRAYYNRLKAYFKN